MGINPEQEEETMGELSVNLVPIVLFVSMFTFLVFAVWFGTRQKERVAFYKSETLRRISESSGEGAKQAIDLLREEERLKRIKTRESIKLGGLINIGVGIGLLIFLWFLVGPKVALCGLIPGLVGVAMLVYVFYMAAPVE
jgi:Mg2+/citrate symporter